MEQRTKINLYSCCIITKNKLKLNDRYTILQIYNISHLPIHFQRDAPFTRITKTLTHKHIIKNAHFDLLIDSSRDHDWILSIIISS